MLYWHRRNCSLTDKDGNLPTLPKRYQPNWAGPYVFQAGDLQTRHQRQYHHQLRDPVHQPILRASMLLLEY